MILIYDENYKLKLHWCDEVSERQPEPSSALSTVIGELVKIENLTLTVSFPSGSQIIKRFESVFDFSSFLGLMSCV